MSQVFISYSSKNREFALKLADSLERFYSTWIDREGIWGGLEWENAIEEALKEAAVFVVIVSPSSNESDWVARETIRAEQLQMYRIPVLLDGQLPLRLLNLQFIDFQGEFEGGLRDLLEVLHEHLDPNEMHHDQVNHLLAEGVRAHLAKDHAKANNLIGQALALQPDLSPSVPAFWENLRTAATAEYSEQLQALVDSGQSLIVEHTELLSNQYDDDSPQYRWNIEVNATDTILDHIDYVKYRLHDTFQPPVRIVRNRKNRFRLTMIGWGTFEIPIEIHFNDGTSVSTSYHLRFDV